MSIEVQAVQRIRVWSESTFAADGTGTLANFTDLPVREGSATMEIMIDSLDPQQTVQHLDGYRTEVLGKRSGKLTFTVNLAPTGTAASNGVTSITSAVGRLLKASMGGESLYEGSVAAAGSTATVVNVSSGDGAQWAAGKVMGWVNSAGQLEVREVESRATDAITLKHGFSGAPSTSDALYGAATYYLTQDPTESLQFIVEGAESDDRWVLLGSQCTSMALTVDPTGAAIPSIQFTYESASWLDSTETAGSLTGTIGTADYSTAYNPIVGHAGHMTFVPNGTATFSTSYRVHASVIAFEPKIVFQRVTSPSGEQTVLQWRRSRQAPVIEGSFTEPFQSLARWTARATPGTKYAAWYQMGRTAGASVLLSAPTVQPVNPQRVADASGLAATTLAWKGLLDADIGSSTDDLAKSAFRIHLV